MQLLLGIGGGEDGLLALEETIDRVAATGDALTIALLDHSGTDHSPEELLALVDTTLEEHDGDVAVTVLDGAPGPALVAFAETGDFDRLLIGGGRRSPMGKIALGEITEFVILNASISVTLVR